MIETTAWDSIRPLLQQLGLDPVRVENVLHPGFPDVNYTHGVIELKYMEAFPVRPQTLVKVPKLEGEQVGFLLRRAEKGGLAWLLVRVGKEWFMWKGRQVHDVWKGLTQADWRQRAYCFKTNLGVEGRDALRDILTGN